jgi:hypothetical protein
VTRQLLERQCDCDFLDEETFRSGLRVDAGALVNRSGQRYRTVIVPPLAAISRVRDFVSPAQQQ